MTDRTDKTPSEHVEVTAAFLVEVAGKQKAYELRRRMWTSEFRPADQRTQALAMSRRRGPIHDPRQRKLDL